MSDSLKREFENATKELIALIEQQENASFFKRQFIIPVRNFLHSMFPTIVMFQSPLQRALDRLVQLRMNWQLKVDQNSNKAPYASTTTTMPVKNGRLQQNANQLISNALQEYITDKIKDDNVKAALRAYIVHQQSQLGATRDPLQNGGQSQDLWAKVRSAIQSCKGESVILDDVLFKLKTLYPAADEDDKAYAEDNIDDSTTIMYQHGFKLTSLNSPKSVSIVKHFASLFATPSISSEEKLAAKIKKIEAQIELLGKKKEGGYPGINNIVELKNNLTTLLVLKNDQNKDNFQKMDQLNNEILKFINNATIDASKSRDSQWGQELEQSYLLQGQQVLRQLHCDINALDCSRVALSNQIKP